MKVLYMHLNLFLKNLAVISSFIIYPQKSNLEEQEKYFKREKKKLEKNQKTLFSLLLQKAMRKEV